MRHIDPKDSSVMQEFERMAVEKGWVVQAALEAGMADQLRKEINAVAELMPKTNAVLDLLVPLAETGGDSTDLRHALDALRASVMDPWLAKGFDEQGGEARSLYHTARSMLHAPEGQGHMWLEGLRALRELLTQHWGQTVEKSPAVPQVTDEEMPPGMADDGQAVADPGFIEGGGTSKFPMPSGLVRGEIDRLWKDLSSEGQKSLLQGLGAPPYVAPGTPHFYSFFGQPRNLGALRDANPAWLKPGLDVMEKRRERSQKAPQHTAPADALWFVAPIVGRVQTVLQGLGFDIGARQPDNVWGPRTNQAWNEFVRKYGLDKQYGLTVMPEIHPGDQSSPPRKDLEFAAEHGAALSVINEPGQEKKSPSSIETVETGPMPPEHIPAGYPADDGSLAQMAATDMVELLSLANDLDAMKAHKAAAAVDDQLRLYKEAADKLYDITGETGEQLIGQAHPGGGPTMVPAQDEGGKVETIVEEHKKVREKATKPPTGKQAAFVAKQLVALANRLDGEGKKEAAMLVDKTLDELRRASRHPFVDSLRREAQTSPKAAKLASILKGMSDDLNAIAISVQDQTDFPGNLETLIEKTTPVRWGFRNYGAEFNEFAEEAHNWLKTQAVNASAIVANTDEMSGLVRSIKQLARALATVRRIYAGVRPVLILGAWSPKAQAAFENYLGRMTELQSLMGSTKPLTEEAAPGVSGRKQSAQNMASRLLQHTVNTIIATIEKYYKGGPAARNLLGDTFKSINIPGMTGDGMTKALRLFENLKKMRGKTYDSVKAQNYNDWLYNVIVTPMKHGLNVVTTSLQPPMMKRATQEMPPELRSAPAKKRPLSRGRGRTPMKERADIEALQTLMDRLGYPLGPTGVDGLWGRHTAAAWEQLKKDVLAMNGPSLPAAAPSKSRGPSPGAVRTAIQLAAYLLRVKGEAGKAVNLAPGVKVPERALGSPEAFLRALARTPISGVKISGPGEVFSKENLVAASGLLSKYRQELSKPGSPEAWNIWTKGGGEAGLRRRVQLVDSLLAQLRTAGSRVPPSGYGYEGGRGALPFGTLEGGPGTSDRGRSAPARSRYPANRGRRMFDYAEAINAFARRLLPSDLLTTMLSTSQFIRYANYVWPPGRKLHEKGMAPKRVALRYLEYIQNGIGRLRGMLSPAVMRQMGVRGQQLRDHILEVLSQIDPLERDLQYGSSY